MNAGSAGMCSLRIVYIKQYHIRKVNAKTFNSRTDVYIKPKQKVTESEIFYKVVCVSYFNAMLLVQLF